MKKEAELFVPVANYFMEKGYDIRAEVLDCDMVAIQGDEVIIVELKLKFNVELLLQVADRLRYSKYVYIAVPSKEFNLFKKKGKKQKHLLRLLGVGVLTVREDNDGYVVRELFESNLMSQDNLRKRNKKKRERLVTEFMGREQLSNIGGVTRVAIHTAYKELSIKIGKELIDGPKSIKEIKNVLGNNPKISSILQKNHYGWFMRVDRGVYELTEKGHDGLRDKI